MKLNFYIISVIVIDCFGYYLHGLEFAFGDCPLLYNEPCRSDLVKFILSIRYRGNGTTLLYGLNPFRVDLPAAYNYELPLKILIHGYGGLKVDSATRNVTKAYQDIGYNTITVDWEPLAPIPCYATSYLNTWHVGQCIAILAVSLIPLGISPNLIHVVGFSLGAHIAGLAGAQFKQVYGSSFSRITGLDPALPFFATLNSDWKLDPSDASFVDVIHTSSGLFGKIEAIGHVDFYINGGVFQPVCSNAKFPPLCSHLTAGLYFAESIRNVSLFIGHKCSNIASYMLGLCSNTMAAIMGEYTKYSTRGAYYVRTREKQPFSPLIFYYFI